MNGAKYRKMLEEILLESAKDLRLGQRFTFQKDNDSKHTARAKKECIRYKHIHVFEWPSQTIDLNSEHMVRCFQNTEKGGYTKYLHREKKRG